DVEILHRGSFLAGGEWIWYTRTAGGAAPESGGKRLRYPCRCRKKKSRGRFAPTTQTCSGLELAPSGALPAVEETVADCGFSARPNVPIAAANCEDANRSIAHD